MKRFLRPSIVALVAAALLAISPSQRAFAGDKKEKAEKVMKMSMAILKVILDSKRHKNGSSLNDGWSNQGASNWSSTGGGPSGWDSSGGSSSGWGSSTGSASGWGPSGGNGQGWGSSTPQNGDAPFEVSPNPAKRGQDVTLRISPSLQSFLPKSTPAKVFYNGRPLPNKPQSGDALVVTLPGDAESGFFELAWGDFRVQATKKLIVSDALRTTSSTFNKSLLPAKSKQKTWAQKKDTFQLPKPEISIEVDPQYLPVSESKRGKTKDIDIDIKLRHSSPIAQMTFRVFGELPPMKDYDIKINGHKFYGQQFASMRVHNPRSSYSLKLKLRRRWGRGRNGRFTYTIEVRVRDSNGAVATRTARIVMERAS